MCRPVLELRIGSVDDPELAFTWFRDLEVGPTGEILTLHPMEKTIRVHNFRRTRHACGSGARNRTSSTCLISCDTGWTAAPATRSSRRNHPRAERSEGR